MESSLAVLNRPLFEVAEAARLLRLYRPKLRRWLEGHTRGDTFYPPVIRPEPTGSEEVTWAEFVEAGLLAEYRTKVPLQRLRPVVDELRQELGIPYPLAHFRPLMDEDSRQLVFEAQKIADLDDDLFLVRRVPGANKTWQLQWAEPVLAFLRKAEFDPDRTFVRRLRPQESAVVIDPAVEFGIPQIKGIRTETIAEAYATGETIDDLSASWSLTPEEIEAAVRWELSITREVA
jgi:uncharacterized protein (DUF433 family)